MQQFLVGPGIGGAKLTKAALEYIICRYRRRDKLIFEMSPITKSNGEIEDYVWCMVLIDLDESTDTHLCVNDDLYEYVDKKPEHEGVIRVVKDKFHKLTVTKHNANPGMAFHKGNHQITIEQGLEYYAGAYHELKLELIDERPDMFNEFTDVLKSEIEQEIDKAVLKHMVEEEKRRNGNNTNGSTEAPENANQYGNIVSAIADATAETGG